MILKRASRNYSIATLLSLLLLAGCSPTGNEGTDEVEAGTGNVPPAPIDTLPDSFADFLEPWKGDLPGMIDRRVIRVYAPYGGYQYFFDRGRPRGAMVELMQRFERYVNEKLERRHVRVHVVVLPVSRDRVLSGLTAGTADLAVGDLTATADRKERYEFTRPLLRDINEVVVTGPSSPPLESIEDLSGKEVYVRQSSSYFEHLENLSSEFVDSGLPPVEIVPADELLEAEDILEMLAAESISLTVIDDYKARFWANAFPSITVRDDLVVNRGGSIAWAHRPGSPKLAALLDEFLSEYGRGTLVGNDTFNRYLEDAGHIRCQSFLTGTEQFGDLIALFQRFGEAYDFDWLMLAAQGFQESRLRQETRSSAGAVGIMQIKPSTAADPNIGVPDVESAEDNIHAGAKYMRFLADRYFSDDHDPLQQWLLTLAAYNAGPARVAQLRSIATERGYDRDRWFDNVEIMAAQQIGAETVGYVSNVYKYYVGYKLATTRARRDADQHGATLTGCNNPDQ